MNQSAGRSTQKTKDTTPTTTTIPTTGKWKMSPEHILRKLKTHTPTTMWNTIVTPTSGKQLKQIEKHTLNQPEISITNAKKQLHL